MTGVNASTTSLLASALLCLRAAEQKEKRKERRNFSCRFLFFRFLKSGPVQTGRPPPVERGGWESDSLRVFNTRQESGNGTRKLRTRSRSVLQYGTSIGDWVPVRLAIRSPFIVIY